MNRSRSRSPLRKEYGDTRRFKGNNGENDGNCEVLNISKVGVYWNLEKIQKFIRDITKSQKIIDGITFIVILKVDKTHDSPKTGEFLVKFQNAYICKQAYNAWTPVSQAWHMKVSYDLDDLYSDKMRFKKPFHFNNGARPNQQMDEHVAKKQIFHQKTHAFNKPDSHETYGLSLQYLNNLKIKPPLGNKLFISNVHPDVTVEKIREVFGLAGHVVHAVVFKKDYHDPPKFFAKVEYDHPVEAVQAISMFHNQQLNSWDLIVHMDTKPVQDLPEGLAGIGPGLGPNGEALRGVRNHIELQPFKKLLNRDGDDNKDFSATNKNMSNFNTFGQPDRSTFTPMATNTSFSVQAPMVTQTHMAPGPVQTQMPMPVQAPNQQSMNTFNTQSSMMNPFNMQHAALQDLQMLENLNQQNPASFQHAVSMLLQNTMGHNFTGHNSDPGGNVSSEWQTRPHMGMKTDNIQPDFSAMKNDNTQPDFSAMKNDNKQPDFSAMKNYNSSSYGRNQNTDNGQRNYNSSKYEEKHSRESKKSSRDEDKSSNNKSDMLIFKNLPRSVTLHALKNKMLEVGELKLAEMTGQGRAIVRFVHTRDAERCIKLFDKSKVDGQIIDVQYF